MPDFEQTTENVYEAIPKILERKKVAFCVIAEVNEVGPKVNLFFSKTMHEKYPDQLVYIIGESMLAVSEMAAALGYGDRFMVMPLDTPPQIDVHSN